MAKKLVLGKENNQYVLCYEANGNISKVTQQMIPANTVLEAFMEINESIDQSNQSIKHTEKVVQEAKIKSTKYCSNVALGTNEYGIFTAEIKKSPAMRAYGYLTMDDFFGSFEASLKTAEIQRDSSPRNYAEAIPKFFEEIS